MNHRMTRWKVGVPCIVVEPTRPERFFSPLATEMIVEQRKHVAKSVHAGQARCTQEGHSATELEGADTSVITVRILHRFKHFLRVALIPQPLGANLTAVAFSDVFHPQGRQISDFFPAQFDPVVFAPLEILSVGSTIGQSREPIVGPLLPTRSHHRVLNS